MSEMKTYHVVSPSDGSEGWNVKEEGRGTVVSFHHTLEEATAAAYILADEAVFGRVKIHPRIKRSS